MRKQNDTLWKGILEPFFREFLLLIDPDLAASVDPAREIIFMDKELNQEIPSAEGIYEQRVVDKLIKLYILDGTEEWILFHLEVQDKFSRDFSRRMFDYFSRLYNKYKKPITAYAIFTEPNVIKRKNVFKISCRGTSLQYVFNTYKIALQDEEMLRRNPNPFALVILIAKATALKKKYKDKYLYDQALMKNKLEIAKLIIEKQISPFKKEILMNFLFNYINFELPETKAIFDTEIKILRDISINKMTIQEILVGQAKLQGKRLGIKEGLKEGKKEGKKEAKAEEIHRLITKLRFSDEQIVDFAGVSLSQVKKIRKKALKIIH